MQRLKILTLAILLIAVLMACGTEKVLYKEGTYDGIGEGHHGPIKVLVTTDKYNIKDIKITEEYEMPEICEIVYEKIPKMVIKKNSEEVDVVTGATFTCNGLIKAIKNALDKAKIKEE